MLECSWFLIYMTLPSSTVSYVTVVEPTTRFNKVNIDLKTYIDIDKVDKDADLKLSINNQKLKGDVKFIISNDRNLRSEFAEKRNKRFTEFIQNAVATLLKYNDKNLKYFWTIFDEEIRKYHYRNCKFFELTGNPVINNFIAHKLQTMKDDSADTIRSKLAAISSNIDNYNHEESKKKLIDFINALYADTDMSKFKRFLLNIETFNIYNGKVNYLRKIIQEGIRSIVFDHYTELRKAARQEIKYRLEEYFQNILKPSTTLLAEITNSMFLDFHVSGEKHKKEYTTKSKKDKLRIGSYNSTKSIHTKNNNIENVKRNSKKIKTHNMERTIIKSELQFDEMFTKTERPNNFELYTTINERNKKEQHTKILKVKRNSEENQRTHSKFITDITKTKRQTSKRHLTQRQTKNILRTLSNKNVGIKTNFEKDKKPTSKFGFIEFITMRPFSPRKTTSFRNIHYMIDLDKNTDIPRDLSALRAKVRKPQTRIPGILFGKVKVRKRVSDDMNDVTRRSIQENVSSIRPKFRFVVRTAPIIRNQNIQFKDESTVEFYRRRVMNRRNDISVTKLTTVSPYTNEVNHFEVIKYLKNGLHDSKSPKERPFLRNADDIKQGTKEKIRNFVNLRINVDDYIKRINRTSTEIKDNRRHMTEIKSTYGEKILKDRQYNSDSFIRGKMDPEPELNEFKITNIVSSSVNTPIAHLNFIEVKTDNKDTQYSNIKTSEMPHLNFLDSDNIKFVKNKNTQVNLNNTVLYTKVVENAESNQGNLIEKKLESAMVNYRKGANQGSQNYHKNLNNGKDFESLPEQVKEGKDKVLNNEDTENKSVEVTKQFKKKDIDLEEYQAKERNIQVKNTDKHEVLINYNSRFTIESRKNNKSIVTSNTAAVENKIFTNQDITTHKSKWSKIKSYVFKSFTDKYTNPYTFDAEHSHNKELNINSSKAKKEITGSFEVSQRSVNEKVKEMDTLFTTAKTMEKLNNTSTVNEIVQLSQVPQEDNKMYRTDFGTIKVFNPSNEITASDLEKMEPIARKQEELSMLQEIVKKKKEVILDRKSTPPGMFAWRRFWNENQNKDHFETLTTGLIDTTGKMEDKDQKYQLVPQPKDPNIFLFMQNY